MARITNNFTIWWETTTKIIQNDYTQSLKGYNVDFATLLVDDGVRNLIDDGNGNMIDDGIVNMVPCISQFHADMVERIDEEVIKLGLIDEYYVVTPH
jgi:hypothetical protein